MKKEMSAAELKKKMSEMDKKDMDKMLLLLYKNCDMAEKFINLYLLDETYADRLLEEYKEKMYKRFFQKILCVLAFPYPGQNPC